MKSDAPSVAPVIPKDNTEITIDDDDDDFHDTQGEYSDLQRSPKGDEENDLDDHDALQNDAQGRLTLRNLKPKLLFM